MSIFSLLGLASGLVKLLRLIFESRLIEKHMAAGEARAIARGLRETNERIDKARAARRAVKHDPGSVREDPRNRD